MSNQQFGFLIFVWLCSAATDAQSSLTGHTKEGQPGATEPRSLIAATRGVNASLSTSSQHDSSNGWSSTLTPGLAWRFNQSFSLDASLPIFTYIVVDENQGTEAEPNYGPMTTKHSLGDLVLSGSLETHNNRIKSSTTLTLGLPTGKPAFGLGAGKVTYSLNGRVERGFGFFTPNLELGLGNSSNVLGSGPVLPYIANATLAYFQIGTTIDLPKKASFSVEAFEELPLSGSTIYSTTNKGRERENAVDDADSAEDNGFNVSLDIPIARHVVLSGFYTRSLINEYDIGGFSLNFLLRPAEQRGHYELPGKSVK